MCMLCISTYPNIFSKDIVSVYQVHVIRIPMSVYLLSFLLSELL